MCDKVVDCLDGEDEMNCNFISKSAAIESMLFLPGEEKYLGTDFQARDVDDVANITKITSSDLDKTTASDEIKSDSSIIMKDRAASTEMDVIKG